MFKTFLIVLGAVYYWIFVIVAIALLGYFILRGSRNMARMNRDAEKIMEDKLREVNDEKNLHIS